MNPQALTQKREEPVPRSLSTASLLGRALLIVSQAKH